ncbi:lipocalin family protein [Psychroserpens mesophilus]|uniref:lipocalin family protein n=1 Tax=Psychroserpens mesophilus TaxID=325473 RepID=UPI003F495A27
MKTVMKLSGICLIALVFNCSNNDDSNDGQPNQLTVQELLVSGKWYQESRTPGTNFTDCEKNGYIEFKVNGVFYLESFDDNSGPCESLGLNEAIYTLSNNRDILIVADSEEINVSISSISQQELTITSSDGETLTFDKTQG